MRISVAPQYCVAVICKKFIFLKVNKNQGFAVVFQIIYNNFANII